MHAGLVVTAETGKNRRFKATKFYAMKYYKVTTVGCKVAQFEGQQAQTLLEQFGLVDAGSGQPDLCVINTCAVTARAAAKTRQTIRALARTSPQAKLAVLGCYASLAHDSIRDLPQLALLADHRRGILSTLRRFLAQNIQVHRPAGETLSNITSCASTYIETDNEQNVKDILGSVPIHNYRGRYRAVLKVQDGCDAHCTYCLIPKLRPKPCSLPTPQVLAQAEQYIRTGHQEMILSGIFLGGYGKTTARRSRRDQPGEPLAELVRTILALPDLGRLRLSSLEPGDLTPRLLDVIADSDKFANHLHLPLQSGSDAVLRRMGRQYSTDQYRQTIDRVRTRLPDMAFTTDIIVGFPGETQSAFKQTLHLAREVGFAKIHIFPFSPRQGTPAYRWQAERPSPEAVKRRLQHLRELEIALALAFRQRFLGRVVRVLVEKTSRREENTYCLGCADPYFPVRFAGNSDLNNQLVHVQIEQVSPTRLAVSGSLQAVVCS